MLNKLNEKKIVITIGIFDKFSRIDENLTFQMRKVAVPNGITVAFLLSDYLSYEEINSFPNQQYDHRAKNLKLFVDDIKPLKTNIYEELAEYINKMREDYPTHKLICVMYENNKSFNGRVILKNKGIPIKFIKIKNGK